MPLLKSEWGEFVTKHVDSVTKMPFQQNSLNSSRKPVEETLLPSVKYWVEVVFKESFLS